MFMIIMSMRNIMVRAPVNRVVIHAVMALSADPLRAWPAKFIWLLLFRRLDGPCTTVHFLHCSAQPNLDQLQAPTGSELPERPEGGLISSSR